MVDREIDATIDILKFAPTMNVFLAIPENLPIYIEARIQAGDCTNAVEYLLDLGRRDRQRKQAQAKLEGLVKID